MTGHLPYYIAIEGPIGVGKTSLAKRLAETFEYELLLEEPNKNPFLDRFYENPRRHALATQLFFLFQRVEQIRTLHQDDLFKNLRIADFLIEKDMLFAQQNLDKDEYNLYGQIYDHLTINAPKPNLVIYLQASTTALLERIKERGIASEQLIEPDYLDQLNHAYAEFFHYYKDYLSSEIGDFVFSEQHKKLIPVRIIYTVIIFIICNAVSESISIFAIN